MCITFTTECSCYVIVYFLFVASCCFFACLFVLFFLAMPTLVSLHNQLCGRMWRRDKEFVNVCFSFFTIHYLGWSLQYKFQCICILYQTVCLGRHNVWGSYSKWFSFWSQQSWQKDVGRWVIKTTSYADTCMSSIFYFWTWVCFPALH